MRIQQNALSEKETAETQALLTESGGKNLAYVRGVFAAVATSPTAIDPPQWLSMLLGDELPDPTRLKRLLTLLMREYNACADCLALSVPAVPAPDDLDAVHEFARGYVQIAQKDAAWTTDVAAFELTIPLMLLSGYVQADSLKGMAPNVAAAPDVYLAEHHSTLQEDLVAIYAFFQQKREARRSPPAASQEKLGRNDPCSCGSGKKYKKCCGQ